MSDPTLQESAEQFQRDQQRARGLLNHGPEEDGYIDELGRVVPSFQKVIAQIQQDAETAVGDAGADARAAAEEAERQVELAAEQVELARQEVFAAGQQANRAEGFAGDALDSANAAGQHDSNAADSAAAAAAVLDQVEDALAEAQSLGTEAQQWAIKPVDQVVRDGEYSAKHHATKAGGSAAAALGAASALNTTLANYTDKPKSIGLRRVANQVVSGNDTLGQVQFDTTDFADNTAGFTYNLTTHRIESAFTQVEPVLITAVVQFQAATQSPGSSRRIQIVQRDANGANPVVLFDVDHVPAQNRPTTVCVAGIKALPIGARLELLVSHNYVVVTAQNLNITAHLAAQVARVQPAPVAAAEAAYIDTLSVGTIKLGSQAAEIRAGNNADYVWSVCDATGRVAIGVKADGGIELSEFVLEAAEITQLTADEVDTADLRIRNAGVVRAYTGPYAWVVMDSNGAVALGVDSAGALHTPELHAGQIILPGATLATAGSEYAWSVADSQGRTALGVKADGSVALAEASADLVSVRQLTASGATLGDSEIRTTSPESYAWSVADAAGNVALAVGKDGTVFAAGLSAGTVVSESEFPAPGFVYELNHLISYGQSLSVGIQSFPLVTTAQKHNSLRFQGGVRAWDAAAPGTYNSLVALVEQSGQNNTCGETPCSGICEYVQDTNAALGKPHTGSNWQLLASAPGANGRTLVQLSKGTSFYNRLLADVQAGRDRAAALGKTFGVWCIAFLHGESDSGPGADGEVYKAGARQLRLDLQADIRAITGQKEPLKFITHQPSLHRFVGGSAPVIAQALLEMALTEPHFYMATPDYFLPRSAVDNIHYLGPASKEMGAQLGRTIYAAMISGRRRKPLHCTAGLLQGNAVILQFASPDPVAELVLDNVTVVDPGNSGFDLVDAGGNALAISSVTVLPGRRVKLVATAALPAVVDVRYAWRATNDQHGGPLLGPRGCLRDDAGVRETFTVGTDVRPLHNWCPIFSVRLTSN